MTTASETLRREEADDRELLAQVLEQGYRLGGGLIGAERAARSVGAEQWRGELVEVLLGKALPVTPRGPGPRRPTA